MYNLMITLYYVFYYYYYYLLFLLFFFDGNVAECWVNFDQDLQTFKFSHKSKTPITIPYLTRPPIKTHFKDTNTCSSSL